MSRRAKTQRSFWSWLSAPFEWLIDSLLDGMQASTRNTSDPLPARDSRSGRWVAEDEPEDEELLDEGRFRPSVQQASD